MKSAKERDAMVKRVNEAVKKWPTVEAMPVGGKGGKGGSIITVPVKEVAKDNSDYIAALYDLCAKGTPLGRSANGREIIGEVEK